MKDRYQFQITIKRTMSFMQRYIDFVLCFGNFVRSAFTAREEANIPHGTNQLRKTAISSKKYFLSLMIIAIRKNAFPFYT